MMASNDVKSSTKKRQSGNSEDASSENGDVEVLVKNGVSKFVVTGGKSKL